MEKKYKNDSYFGQISKEIASAIKYTDIESKTCRQELGMQDFGIWDIQLSSSSWQPFYEPKYARPQLSGWCAGSTDAEPFIQVDFVHMTSVDGIILINWYKLVDLLYNNTYKREMVAMGSFSFHISYGFDLQKLQRTRMYTYDSSRKLGEPQTFIFNDPFLAKYLRIYPRPFLGSNVSCLKFEILGCRNLGNYLFFQYCFPFQNLLLVLQLCK
ncbi:probable carboxypeptidase X1 [Mercenaria mercenaria]|uniref:probable carboxypeptidase X1 n=1 Tax=Mercenaria mercenaria TaxID=6596 RepID=UPI00234EBAC0|nr:probable carboxypeptidase X1 [Mercenaria mercenaria]